MPITARLSRKFYERLGDEVAGELVDLLNTVDAAYRAEHRELLDARLAQFSAELRGDMDRFSARLRGEMNTLSAHLRGEMRALSTELRAEMSGLRLELRGEMATLGTDLRSEMKTLHAELTVRLKSQETRLIRYMVGLWATSTIALMAAILASR
jgi:hypothetical protein